jgi:hypothetical protein
MITRGTDSYKEMKNIIRNLGNQMQKPDDLVMDGAPNIDLSNSGMFSPVTKTVRNKTNQFSQYAKRSSVQSGRCCHSGFQLFLFR